MGKIRQISTKLLSLIGIEKFPLSTLSIFTYFPQTLYKSQYWGGVV